MSQDKYAKYGFFLVILLTIVFFCNLISFSPTKNLRTNAQFSAAQHLYEQFPNLVGNTEAPVIGILTQGTTDMAYYDNYTMIAGSYVKYIEAAGGRVVAIPYNLNHTEFERIYQNLNGLLITGGRMKLIFPRNKTEDNDSEFKWSNFAKSTKYFIDRAMEDYEKGIYFPILGICLGQEAIALALYKDLKNTLTTFNFTSSYYLQSAGMISKDVRGVIALLIFCSDQGLVI